MSGPSIAQLGLRIYSEEVDEAASALDRLVQSGARTNKEMAALNLKQAETARAAGELGNAVGRTNQELAALNLKQAVAARAAGESAQSLAEMAKTASQANAELTALNLKQQYAAQALGDLAKSSGLTVAELRELNVQQRQSAQLLQNLGTVMGQSTAEFRAVAASLNAVVAQNQAVTASAPKTTRAIKEQGDQVARLLGQIDPTVAALDRLDAQQRKLQGFKKSGLIDADTFEQYNSRLEQTRAGLGNFDTQLERTGMSAKATAAAMRGVPAQLTDIVVSLQAGQAPLTVFLQQGGQLKDMFGGLGPAAKALGGYVLGLVNPFTLAAAAAAVLGVAYYQGSEEASRYTKAIILTGNAAGVSTGQMADMAASISRTTGTTGQASEALVLLAESAKIPASQFETIGKAAVAFSSATGRAIDDVVGEFVRLADEPTKAAAALDEKYRFLTLAVYEQIKALEEQGDKQEAARVAEDAYAKALTERSAEIKRNLGTIEGAWASLGSMAKRAWDAMLNIGRPDTMQDRISDLKKQIAELEGVTSSTGGRQAARDDANRKAQIEQLRSQLVLAQQQKDTEDAIAAAQGVYNEKQTKAKQAAQAIDALTKSTLSNEEKRNKEIDEYKRSLEDLREVNPNDDRLNPAAVDKVIANIQAKYKDAKIPKIKAPALDTESLNQLQNDLKLVVGEYDSAEKKIEASAQAGLVSQRDAYTQRVALLDQEKEKVRAAYADQIGAIEQLQDRGNLSAQQRIQLAQRLSDAQTAQTKALSDLDAKRDQLTIKEQGRLKKLQLSTESYSAALGAQVEALRQQGERAAAAVGMGRQEAQLYAELNKVNDEYVKGLKELDKQLAERSIDQEEYTKRLALLQRQQQDLTDQTVANYKTMAIAQADWAKGANSAFQDYLSAARDVAGQTRDLFTDALSGIENYLVSFITRSKASFKDLVRSVGTDLARIGVRQLLTGGGSSSGGIVGSLSSVLGGNSGSGGGSGSGVSNALSLADTGIKAYNFLTGTGANLYNAYQAGGLSGVYDYGASSIAGYFGSSAASAAGSSLTSAGASAAIGAQVDATAAGLGYLGNTASTGVSYTAASTASAASSAGLSTLGAAGYGIGGAIAGYQAAGLKGAATGAGGAVAGAYAGAAIGSVVPIIGTAIGAAIGAMLGGMLGSSVWGGDWITKDNGLALGVTGGDFDGASFEYQKKKGGLFGKNKKRTNFTPLDSATESALQEVYDTTEDSVETLYKKLGVQLNDGVLSGLTIGRTQISTKDKTQEEIQKEITAWFSTVADSMTSAINDATGAGVGGYNFEALTAFVNNLYSVNDAFRYLRIGMFDTSVAGGKLAESMAATAGGLSALQQSAAGYYQNFFSDTEKANDTMAEAVRQFGLVNITLPATREGFRDLVESMEKTTEAGQEQISTLLGLQGQADAYYDILEQRMQQATQALAEAQAAMLNGAMGTLQRAVKREQDALTAAYAARTESLNASLATSQSAVSSLTSMSTNLTSALRTLQGQSDAATSVLYGQATATLESAAAIARAGGSLANFQGLDQAVSTVAGNSAGKYGDWLSFARDQGRSTALINELSITAGDQLTNAEKTVKSLQDQLDQSKKSYDMASAKLQGQLDLAQAQLDGINGVNNTLLSIEEALKQFGAAIGTAAPNGTGATNADSIIEAAYKAALGRSADSAGAAYWKGQLSSGAVNSNNLATAIGAAGAANVAAAPGSVSAAYASILGRDPTAADMAYWVGQVANGGVHDVAAAIRAAAIANGEKMPAFAGGGDYLGGKALVGEHGPEIIDFAQPGYVYNARQTAGMLSEADLSRVIALLQQILSATGTGNDRLFWVVDNTRKAAVNTQVLRNQAAEGATA
ncbi:phage tail tape measure protein [Pseudomonas aestiva]|uniref:phage tail tape measure protein n=1 Tax=Pseudomonas aestiva TaxID=3136739 RepID=UPI003265D39C